MKNTKSNAIPIKSYPPTLGFWKDHDKPATIFWKGVAYRTVWLAHPGNSGYLVSPKGKMMPWSAIVQCSSCGQTRFEYYHHFRWGHFKNMDENEKHGGKLYPAAQGLIGHAYAVCEDCHFRPLGRRNW